MFFKRCSRVVAVVFAAGSCLVAAAQAPPAAKAANPSPANPKAAQYKKDLAVEIDGMKELTQQMVDQVFSFGELGFQEIETSKYLTNVLKQNGFRIDQAVAGIPTAWTATWGSGKPVIALGSDVDCIPQASQKPGVAYHDPIIEGAPGHGEGHNSGMPLNITAALALKKLMEREHIPGTILLWPGIAEELLATKAYFVRAGVFKDADVVLFAHVGSYLGVSWGDCAGTGLV
jgi:aminobenzoyl-glutamate utilization protein B